MKFYAACLASYNNGVLHGRWVDASSDTDEMQGAIDAMLRESRFPNVTVACEECMGTGESFPCVTCKACKGHGEVPSAEEWAIHDYDGLPSSFGEYPGLDKIAAFVELLDDHDHFDEDDLRSIVADFSDLDEAADALRDRFVGVYSSFWEYAEEYADEMMACEGHKDDSMVARYFDYEAFARDLQMDMHTIDVSSGTAIFHA